MSDEKIGFENVRKGEKKLSSWGLFGNKYEDAVEFFVKGGNHLKAAGHYEEAAASYMKAVECFKKLNSTHDAALNMVEAAHCLRRLDPERGAQAMAQASGLFIELGRFSTAAKHFYDIGEIYENESAWDQAIEAYETSTRYYMNAEQPAMAQKSMLKSATICAQVGRYRQAIDLFEAIAAANLDGPGRFSVRDYYFRAMVTHFAHASTGGEDLQNCRIALTEYDQKDVNFADSREFKFCDAVIHAWEDYSVTEFEDAVRDYDNVSRLSTWATNLLLLAREAIERGPSLT